MSRTPAGLVLLLTAASVTAGCLDVLTGSSGSRTVRAAGDAFFSEAGWAYAGDGRHVNASFEGKFDEAANTGSATIEVEGFRVAFDRFFEAPGKTFQSGGVAFDIVEHGDSGVADASVPRILAVVAAWGEANVTSDGTPFPDPVTGAPTWLAHVMASDTTVRGADGKIAAKDGARPYDPASPSDARRIEGDRQLLFSLKARPRTMAVEPFNATDGGEVRGEYNQSFAIPAQAGGRIGLALRGSGPGPFPAGLGELSVILEAPSGAELITLGGQYSPADFPIEEDAAAIALETGDYTVDVTGRGTFTYSIGMSVDYATELTLTLTWDDFETS